MTRLPWDRRITLDQRRQVERELSGLGLDPHQVASILKQKSPVKDIELLLMVKMPANPISGQRPTIGVVREIIHSLRVLGLIEKVKENGQSIPPRGFLSSMPEPTMKALEILCSSKLPRKGKPKQ